MARSTLSYNYIGSFLQKSLLKLILYHYTPNMEMLSSKGNPAIWDNRVDSLAAETVILAVCGPYSA